MRWGDYISPTRKLRTHSPFRGYCGTETAGGARASVLADERPSIFGLPLPDYSIPRGGRPRRRNGSRSEHPVAETDTRAPRPVPGCPVPDLAPPAASRGLAQTPGQTPRAGVRGQLIVRAHPMPGPQRMRVATEASHSSFYPVHPPLDFLSAAVSRTSDPRARPDKRRRRTSRRDALAPLAVPVSRNARAISLRPEPAESRLPLLMQWQKSVLVPTRGPERCPWAFRLRSCRNA